VELKTGGANNAFLTGPLEMRAGVTLLIDEGVTLFGCEGKFVPMR
jgi:polygalacturonase